MYFRRGSEFVSSPTVREGRKVVLHIENYNNYLYDVAVEVENEPVFQVGNTPGEGLKGLLSQGAAGMGNPLDMLLGGGGGESILGAFRMFPGLSGRDIKGSGSGWGTSPEEIAHRDQVEALKKVEAAFEQTRDRVYALEEELSGIEEAAKKKVVANRVQAFAAAEIAQLRYNAQLEPRQIKRLSAEFMSRIFEVDDPEKIDLEQVLKIADAQQEATRILKGYGQKVGQYTKELDACKLYLREFKKFSFPNSNLEMVTQKAESFTSAVESRLSDYQAKSAELDRHLQQLQSLDPQTLAALRTTYLELANNRFSKTYTHTATGERMKFKIILTPIDSLRDKGMRPKVTPLELGVYGGLRVRAGVGLGYAQYFRRPQQYFVRDSFLLSSNRDAFTPTLTSFIHFYAPSRRAVSFAGSFGIGFPMSGGESLQSVSFFLGPSLVFGKSERVVLSGGIVGGKVERLSQGYKVGDGYSSDANEAPIESVYDLGYFLGFSFSLAGR
jgi:hypothetical protein